MSQENVELVKLVHPPSGTELTGLFSGDAANSGALEQVASLLTDDFVAIGGDKTGSLGFTAGGEGIDGLITAWRGWLSPWETYWTEVEEFLDAPGDRVVVLVCDHGRLRGSESEVKNVSASVWT